MKKTVLLLVLALTGIIAVNAQEKVRFGATAGFVNATASAKFEGIEVSESQAGFYFGFVADAMIAEKFNIQTEVLYNRIDESDFLQLPIMGKYYVAEKVNLQAGFQLAFDLGEKVQDVSNFSFGIGPGLGVDITEDFFVDGRYMFQLNNSYTGPEDLTAGIDFLNIGIGYKF